MSSSVRIGLLWMVAAFSGFMVACDEGTSSTFLQPLDLSTSEDFADTFDRNAIVFPEDFVDAFLFDARSIQSFLGRTPYGRPSFLETYQSNGIRAAEAIDKAATTYGVNPMVFLVFAQITQGLIGERDYPFPPERVEYVFGCGCVEPNRCAGTLAGFDRQVDCLGRALRTALDEIRANNVTTSGWGPGVETLSLDNITVIPEDDATAALYDRLPRVAEGKAGGTWIFWNVWNRYTSPLAFDF
ncbi:MAG TPA: hypothetical protein VM580_17580 [Labilithrix sp.]|nr:hypothetical protein [Labilithrix sp.]